MHAVTDNAAQRVRFTRVLRRSLTKGAAWFAAVAVLSGFYFGQVEVGGFTLGLGHSVVQSDRGVDSGAYDKVTGGGDWR